MCHRPTSDHTLKLAIIIITIINIISVITIITGITVVFVLSMLLLPMSIVTFRSYRETDAVIGKDYQKVVVLLFPT
jgi:hypothetical protein